MGWLSAGKRQCQRVRLSNQSDLYKENGCEAPQLDNSWAEFIQLPQLTLEEENESR